MIDFLMIHRMINSDNSLWGSQTQDSVQENSVSIKS